MTNLISDLLLLSKLENRGKKLEIELINLKSLLVPIINIFKDKIEAKSLKINLAIPDNLNIKGDSSCLSRYLSTCLITQ